MYEKIAWENFCKTGDIESFMEYKKMVELNNKEENILGEKGDVLSEFSKSKGDSNQGNNV